MFAFPTVHCAFLLSFTVLTPAAELGLDVGGLPSRGDTDRDQQYPSHVRG